MPSENILRFAWPEINNTVCIVALVLALAIFAFAAFSGIRANKKRFLFTVLLSTLIGFFTVPLAAKLLRALHVLDTQAGIVFLVTAMMLFVTAVATSIYEIITVTMPDVGLTPKK